MGKFWAPWNKGKKKPSPKGQKKVRKIAKELGKITEHTWGFPGTWDPWDMQQRQVRIKTVQGGAKKHKEQEQLCPYQPPNDVEKGSEGLGTNNS